MRYYSIATVILTLFIPLQLMGLYQVEELLPLEAGQQVEGLHLNNRGEGVIILLEAGKKEWDKTFKSYFYSKEAGLVPVPGEQVQLAGINNHGIAIGQRVDNGNVEAILFDGNDKTVKSLHSFAGATAINDDGKIVGWHQARRRVGEHSSVLDLFVYDKEGGFQDLGSLAPQFWRTVPTGINDHGVIVGYADHINGLRHAFLYVPGKGMVDLGSLGNMGETSRINALGQAIGEFNHYDGDPLSISQSGRSFIATERKGMEYLSRQGQGYPEIMDINDRGLVVGQVEDGDGVRRAFYYHPASGVEYLSVPTGNASPPMTIAFRVSNRDSIVGAYSVMSEDEESENEAPYRSLLSPWRPVLWKGEHQELVPLNEEIGESKPIYGIAITLNNQDEILVLGYQKGDTSAKLYLLRPSQEQ